MFFVLLGPAFALAADDAARTESEARLARQLSRLAQQLDDDRAAQRDAAESELLELAGSTTADFDRFLELLPADTEQMPLAVRDRLARIRQDVEARMAEAAVSRTAVTISADKLPLPEVLAAIDQQTGNRFLTNQVDDGELAKIAITIELKDEPFWSAMDQILDQGQLGIYAYSGDDAIALVSRSPQEAERRGRASYSGPFRIELLEVQAQRSLRRLAGDALKLQLQIAWEPRLRPIVLSQSMTDVEATTDAGQRLAVKQPQAVLDVEVPGGTQAAEIVLPFELPPRKTERLAVLRGTLQALVPGRQVQFRFEELAQAAGKSQRHGGVQVMVDDIRRNNEIWEIHMRFSLDEPSGALQSHRGWIFQNRSYLIGKDGEPIDNIGFETTRQTPREIGIAYLFDLPDGIEGLAWVYATPAAIVELPVEYELTNVALP
jgi:hypothetical protein